MKHTFVDNFVVGLITIVLFIIFVTYATDSDVHKRTPVHVDAGIVQDVSPVQTSWNESQRTMIKTDQRVIFVLGYPSVPLNVRIHVIDGEYVYFEGQSANERSMLVSK